MKVQIMGCEYILRSERGEEHVHRVAAYLDEKLGEVLSKSRTSSTMAATVLAALNITNELMQLKEEQNNLIQEIEAKAELMLEKIERA